jgi:hypothetical protein
MPERKYSITEIDRMRSAVYELMVGPHRRDRAYTFTPPDEKHVEERLRTYMSNGTDPAELSGEVARRQAEIDAMYPLTNGFTPSPTSPAPAP